MDNPGYPFESRFFRREGISQHYLDEGEGPPVVMVHGNPTWSFYYRNLVSALRDRHRVIVPDHVGCGLSDKPGDDRYAYTLSSRVNDLEALLEHAGVTEDVTLVVHDWGGMIGTAWAVRHPERIRRLVFLNTAPFHLPKGKRLPPTLMLCRTFIGAPLVRGLNLFCLGALRECVKQRVLTREERHSYLAPYDSWSHRIAVHRFIQDIPLKIGDPAYNIVSEVESGLDRFRDTPTLLLWGMKDFVFDHEFLAEFERRMPHARVHRFEGAGHYVLEDAFDEILPLVEDFLADR